MSRGIVLKHLEILVEEASAEALLRVLLPLLLQQETTFEVHSHSGKHDLLRKLPDRLRGYASWLPSDWGIVVLVDQDEGDCMALKSQLNTCCRDAGLRDRQRSLGGRYQIMNRIAIEELEAWLRGDPDAIRRAYARVPVSFEKRARFRHPDAVKGGTWEALQDLLQRAGHFRTGLRKVELAHAVAQHMDPARNQSPSFQAFVTGIRALIEQ